MRGSGFTRVNDWNACDCRGSTRGTCVGQAAARAGLEDWRGRYAKRVERAARGAGYWRGDSIACDGAPDFGIDLHTDCDAGFDDCERGGRVGADWRRGTEGPRSFAHERRIG